MSRPIIRIVALLLISALLTDSQFASAAVGFPSPTLATVAFREQAFAPVAVPFTTLRQTLTHSGSITLSLAHLAVGLVVAGAAVFAQGSAGIHGSSFQELRKLMPPVPFSIGALLSIPGLVLYRRFIRRPWMARQAMARMNPTDSYVDRLFQATLLDPIVQGDHWTFTRMTLDEGILTHEDGRPAVTLKSRVLEKEFRKINSIQDSLNTILAFMLMELVQVWTLLVLLPELPGLGQHLVVDAIMIAVVPVALGVPIWIRTLLKRKVLRDESIPVMKALGQPFSHRWIYSVTRNPMYLGYRFAGLVLTAASLYQSEWGLALAWLSVWPFTSLLAKIEEDKHGFLGGKPYEDYRRRVPRWIGRVGAKPTETLQPPWYLDISESVRQATQKAFSRLWSLGNLSSLSSADPRKIWLAAGAYEIQDPQYPELGGEQAFFISPSVIDSIREKRQAYLSDRGRSGPLTLDMLYELPPAYADEFKAPEEQTAYYRQVGRSLLHPEFNNPGIYFHSVLFAKKERIVANPVCVLLHEILEEELDAVGEDAGVYGRYFSHHHPVIMMADLFIASLMGPSVLTGRLEKYRAQIKRIRNYLVEDNPDRQALQHVIEKIESLLNLSAHPGFLKATMEPVLLPSVTQLNQAA